MAFRLETVFNLIDRATGPARRINAALDALDRSAGRRIRITDETTRSTARLFRITETEARQALQWGQRIQNGQERIRAAHERVSSAVGQSARAYGTLQMAIGRVVNAQNALIVAGLGIGAGLLGKGVLDQMGWMEQQRIALTTMLKTPEKADFTLRTAIRFADVTPFDTKDVLAGIRNSLGMGFKRPELGPLMQGTGNAAAAMGLSSPEWLGMLRVFGQIRNAGQLYAQDAMQLSSLGLPVWEVLAKSLKKTVPEIKKLSESGEISGTYTIRTLLRFFNKEYAGAMDRQSKSLFGLSSTLKSRMDSIWANLEGSGALKPLNSFLMNLVQLSDFTKYPGNMIARGFSEGVQNIVEAIFGPMDQFTRGANGKIALNKLLMDFRDFTLKVKAWVPIVKKNIQDFWDAFKAPFLEVKAFLDPVVKHLDRFSRALGGSGTNWAQVAGGVAAFLLLGGAIRTVNGLLFGLPALMLKMTGRGLLAHFGGLGIRAATALKGGLTRLAGRSDFWAEVMTNPGGKLKGLGVAMWVAVKGGLAMIKSGLTTLFPGLPALAGRITTFLRGIGTRITGLWGLLLAPLRSLGAKVAPLLASLRGLIGGRLAGLFGGGAASAGLKMIGKGFLALLGPVGMVVSVIWTVWDALKMLWTSSPAFRNGVIAVWEGVKEWFRALPGAISKFAGQAAEFLGFWFTKGKNWAIEKLGGIIDWFKDLPTAVATAMKNFSWAGVGDAIKNGIKGALGWAGDVWDNISAGWSKGVNKAEAAEAGKVLAKATETGARTAAEIHSPSRLFGRLGGYVSEGFAGGIDAQGAHAVAAMEKTVARVAKSAKLDTRVSLQVEKPEIPQRPNIQMPAPQSPAQAAQKPDVQKPNASNTATQALQRPNIQMPAPTPPVATEARLDTGGTQAVAAEGVDVTVPAPQVVTRPVVAPAGTGTVSGSAGGNTFQLTIQIQAGQNQSAQQIADQVVATAKDQFVEWMESLSQEVG